LELNVGDLVHGERPQNSGGIVGLLFSEKPAVSLKRDKMIKVTVDDQQEVAYTLLVDTKIDDLHQPLPTPSQ